MPRDYNEWKKNVEFQNKPNLYVLYTFHDTVKQFINDPNSKAAKTVLDIAMECVGQYLADEDKKYENV